MGLQQLNMGRNDCLTTFGMIAARVHLMAPLKVRLVANLSSLVINKILGIFHRPLNHYFSDNLYRS